MAKKNEFSSDSAWGARTALVHGGGERSQWSETSEAMFLTSGFVYGSAAEAERAFATPVAPADARFVYSRFGNPTVAMFEARLAALEGAEACKATASGMAAVFAALACQLKTGMRIVSSRALFGSCHYIVTELLPRWGIDSVLVDGADLDAWRAALQVKTDVVFLETPSNPMLDLVDLAAVAKLAKRAGACVVVDNVFATPLLQQPLALGASPRECVVDGGGRDRDGRTVCCDQECRELHGTHRV